MGQDSELVDFVRSIIVAAVKEFGDQPVTEPGSETNPQFLYTETHYALSALLIHILDESDNSWLDLTESRLRIFDRANVPPTFFNALAICLIAIIAKRAKIKHSGLLSVLDNLLERTNQFHHTAYKMWCGNNMYLQQVVVDTFLLPLCRGESVASQDVSCLLGEFRKFQTAEGFFFDLPRNRNQHELLCPPTYIMKDLFLAGVCNKLQPVEEITKLVQYGMTAVLPLLTSEGNFSYFGRTDNTPFAAALTIFNLRQAAQLCPEQHLGFQEACRCAETYYKTFPRTGSGFLQCNRFADASTSNELVYSRDNYSYIGQYTLSSCAYALLGCYWYPMSYNSAAAATLSEHEKIPSATESKDLGLVKLSGPRYELFLRTGPEISSRDRRYLGPTILRYKVNDCLLIGTISRTLASDFSARTNRPTSRLLRAFDFFWYKFVNGKEMLDGTSVGFLPVLRNGHCDYLPSKAVSVEISPSFVCTRHHMVRVSVRGFHPCIDAFLDLFCRSILRLVPKSYVQPRMIHINSIKLSRFIHLEENGCFIEDCVHGDIKDKTLLFSTRSFFNANIEVRGLQHRQTVIGWGSDGRQIFNIYEAQCLGSEFTYQVAIRALPEDSR